MATPTAAEGAVVAEADALSGGGIDVDASAGAASAGAASARASTEALTTEAARQRAEALMQAVVTEANTCRVAVLTAATEALWAEALTHERAANEGLGFRV